MAITNLTTLAVAEGGGFNLLDPNGAGNFIWTLAIFLVSLIFMWKFVFAPITAALYERDEKASEAIIAAKQAEETAEKLRAEMEVSRGEAQAEAQKLLADARERAEASQKKATAEAQEKAENGLQCQRETVNNADARCYCGDENDLPSGGAF